MPTETPALSPPGTSPKPPLDRDGWLGLLHAMGEESGSFEALGPRHWALFNEDGGDLLVTFDALETIMGGDAGTMPPCFGLATRRGWSHLSLIVEGADWYRSPDVYAYFDRLVDEDFFGNFDRVLFYGAGVGAHAACAYSVAAPGATVLVLEPCATLDPSLASWDLRHRDRRRLNFTDRYGYGPDMIEGAGQVYLLFDPHRREEAMHAALYRARHVMPLRLPHLGGEVDSVLIATGILPDLLKLAMERGIDRASFAQLWRKRRESLRYLRSVLVKCARAKRPLREAAICRWVGKRFKAPGFRRHLADLEARGLIAATPKAERRADRTGAESLA